MELNKTVKVIGSLVLAIIKIGIPLLCGLSFAFNWLAFIKFILILTTLGIVIIDASVIYSLADN